MTEAAINEEIETVDWKDKALRAMADLDNYRKRMQKELEQSRDRAEADTIIKFLDLADDMRRMIDSFRDARGPQARKHMVDGANLVFARFMNILQGLGTTRFEAQGQKYAAELMEAIAQTETTALPPGTVVDELEQGFMRNGRLLKPARVVVAALPPGGERNDNE